MPFRIEVFSKGEDTRADVLLKRLKKQQPVTSCQLRDVYTLDVILSEEQVHDIATLLTNPVTHTYQLHGEVMLPFAVAVETGFLPGVTDNVGTTTKQIIEGYLGKDLLDTEAVYTSQLLLLGGAITGEEGKTIAASLINPLIQRSLVKDKEAYVQDGGMGIHIPKVILHGDTVTSTVPLLGASDEELMILGKKGISNPDGTFRGPLGLSIQSMKAIQSYFKNIDRNPTDIELETLAQTWSEHCKHTIFASPLDDIQKGLYKHYIKRATEEIRDAKGADDFCVSVFKDNAGGIIFDEEWLVCDKAETHNSPSALDPFGGAITGIVGVNRDCIGFGQGAKPIVNKYGFCFADPRKPRQLFRDAGLTNPILSPQAIIDGVVHGVNVGGNCSGIPTSQGFAYFDDRYAGKPLVFVGTIGLLPRVVNGRPGHDKKALPGDYIVMVGGRVGKDGIHGATFSSEALDEGSPATAVQIGDPITQKKFSDALVKEVRALGLYRAITDDGAGGLSSSVGEMANDTGGCIVELDKVPLKYPGMMPWEIWISESQERMTLAVASENIDALFSLLKRRGVEASVIGTYTDSGRCVLMYNNETIMDLPMDFLHDGVPISQLFSSLSPTTHEEPPIKPFSLQDLATVLPSMLVRLNICSKNWITTQYDHEVQGTSIIKPLQGKGKINAEASVVRPVLSSQKAIVLSQNVIARYSDINTYHMAACALDTAVRNAVAAGANLDYLALMDNFCWCSSGDPERLGQLVQSVKACYDVATVYGTPFISGKDSMFNDFKGYDDKGNPILLSVPPTLMISTMGVIPDATKALSIDTKNPGDLVYILGATKKELGASEYYAERGEQEKGEAWIGNMVPEVNPRLAAESYRTFFQGNQQRLFASAIAVTLGGIGVALAKMAMAGQHGLSIECKNIMQADEVTLDELLFSESQSRIIFTADPKHQEAIKTLFSGFPLACIGEVTEGQEVTFKQDDQTVSIPLSTLTTSYFSSVKGDN